MLSNQIKALLTQNGRIIIPELGALIIKDNDPNAIYFNEFLKFNDNILTDYVSSQEQISKDEANKKISAYVKRIQSQLESSKIIGLEGLGTLFIDNDEKIQFKSNQTEITSKPQTTTATPPSEPKIHHEPIAEKKVVKSEPLPKTTTELKKKFSPIKSLNKRNMIPSISKSKIIWFSSAVVIIALAAGIFIWIAKKKPAKEVPPQTFGKDTIIKPDSSAQFQVNQKAQKFEPKQVKNGKQFYLVAGCFTVEDNADKMVEKLISDGYQAEKFGKVGNLYAVSIAKFDNKNAALDEINALKEKGILVWWVRR